MQAGYSSVGRASDCRTIAANSSPLVWFRVAGNMGVHACGVCAMHVCHQQRLGYGMKAYTHVYVTLHEGPHTCVCGQHTEAGQCNGGIRDGQQGACSRPTCEPCQASPQAGHKQLFAIAHGQSLRLTQLCFSYDINTVNAVHAHTDGHTHTHKAIVVCHTHSRPA